MHLSDFLLIETFTYYFDRLPDNIRCSSRLGCSIVRRAGDCFREGHSVSWRESILTMPLRRIALLGPVETPDVLETARRFGLVADRFGIHARLFNKSDDLIDFAPDCVLALSCQDGKLTPFPTYGVLMSPVAHYLRTRRFVRNILSYDGYLTISGTVRTWLKDITFGVRKFSAPIGAFAPTVQSTHFIPLPMNSARLVHVGANTEPARWMGILRDLASDGTLEIHGPPGAWRLLPGSAYKGPVPTDGTGVLRVYANAGVGLDLPSSQAREDSIPSLGLLEIVAASALAITGRHPFLESVFGTTLFYVDFECTPEQVARQIRSHVSWIREHPEEATRRAREAHRIFSEKLAMDGFFPSLMELHARVMVEKGYAPAPDARSEDELPSVTYIMRTGGGRPMRLLRRALDSLVAQQYPKLCALLVLFREMPEIDELRSQYPTLNIEVVNDIGGLRSTAICAGMRNVHSDLFGLLDDDDYLHPNHVRMLVKALKYHNGRNWRGQTKMAYSGSVIVSECEPLSEQNEYEDAYALTRRECRSLEHYRAYNATAMSEHRWYLINTWLADRSLIDDELLNDPMIHTCEDLYVALQFAQRTFLAFSGEVTTVHYFGQHGNSTLEDSWRHFPDTLRIAIRMWSRPHPTETGYLSRFLPLGREVKQPVEVPTELGSNIIGRLVVSETARRLGGRIVLGGEGAHEVETVPLELSPAFYMLSLHFDSFPPGAPDGSELELSVYLDFGDSRKDLLRAAYRRQDLTRHGDTLHADVLFEVEQRGDGARLGFRLACSSGHDLILRRMMLVRHSLSTANADSPT